MSGKKIVLILCFAMGLLLWQAFSVYPAHAGMIDNMLDGLKSAPAPAPAPVKTRPAPDTSRLNTHGIPAQELEPDPGPVKGKVDEVVVFKAKRLLELRRHGKPVRRYRIALGRNPIGHKLYQGDNRTPEGHYRIDMRNANSNYFRSLRISYPDRTDQDVALTVGLRPGDWIMIHGLKNGYTARELGHPNRDWTNGCIALDNQAMTEVWNLVDVGTPITIYP
jgi:murein L,D-transpeptidase YafK